MHPLGLALLLAPLASSSPSPPLRVCLDPRSPPWVFVAGRTDYLGDQRRAPSVSRAELKSLVGMDVDVMNALARQLGRPPSVVPLPWLGLEEALETGQCDAILDGWTPSAMTPEGIRASVPYSEWGLVVVVRAGEARIQSFRDLEGREVGHYLDPAVLRPLIAAKGGLGHLTAYDAVYTLFADLKAGKLDAVIFDSVHVHWRLDLDASLRVVGQPLNRLGYHVGLRAQDEAFRDAVDRSLKALEASGELAAIRRKWKASP